MRCGTSILVPLRIPILDIFLILYEELALRNRDEMRDYPNLREVNVNEYSMVYSTTPLKGASVKQLEFMTGAWKGKSDGDQIEEHWMSEVQNNRTGMFRWIKDGEVFVYEIMTLVERNDEVQLLLRHFGKDFECWEEKENPMIFIATIIRENKAIFMRSTRPESGFLMYERIDEKTLKFSDLEPDGSVSFELHFTKIS